MYYVNVQEFHDPINMHLKLLEQGLHQNRILQNDYNVQKGHGFTIKIYADKISVNCANQIINMLLKADPSAYNHENLIVGEFYIT